MLIHLALTLLMIYIIIFIVYFNYFSVCILQGTVLTCIIRYTSHLLLNARRFYMLNYIIIIF